MTAAPLGVGYSINAQDDFAMLKLGPSLDEAERLGVDFVELPLYGFDVIARGRVIPEKLRRLKEIVAGRPFRYTVHGPLAVNLMDEPERMAQHRSMLRLCLEVSGELGAVHYVQHNGIVDGKRESVIDDRYALQREALAELAPLCESLGVVLCVENLWTYDKARLTGLPSRLAREIEAIGHPSVRACLDFSHGYINSTLHGADFVAECLALAPLAKHLHIHDSFGGLNDVTTYSRAERLAYGLGDLHLPLGLGAIPWDRLMSEARYPGGVVLMLELAPPYWSELAGCVRELRRLASLVDAPRQPADAVLA